MKHYKYSGPVLSVYGQCTTPNWSGETHANTIAKAQSSMKYRYKKEHGLLQSAKIFLPNDVVEI